MSRVFLVHWNEPEALERAERLRGAGHEVGYHASTASEGMKALRDDPPEVFVIDLTRLPSHGGAVATWIRQNQSTRRAPIVFIEGDPEKTAKLRERLPDATFTSWPRVRGAIRQALRRPLAKPVVPGTMDAYSGTPLPKKLGIRDGSIVALLGAPKGFLRLLGTLPPGVVVRDRAGTRADVILLFATRRADLARKFPGAARATAEKGRIWIAWPKKASGVRSDLSDSVVRAFGIASGWVDFKIAAIDDTWSGLCFSRKARRR